MGHARTCLELEVAKLRDRTQSLRARAAEYEKLADTFDEISKQIDAADLPEERTNALVNLIGFGRIGFDPSHETAHELRVVFGLPGKSR